MTEREDRNALVKIFAKNYKFFMLEEIVPSLFNDLLAWKRGEGEKELYPGEKFVDVISDPKFKLYGYNLVQIRKMIAYCKANMIEFCGECGAAMEKFKRPEVEM